MQRIIVIGCPGSGKTTFSNKLAATTGLPLYHLDAIWHKADRTHISRDEFDERLTEILERDSWIIDGHYSRTLERRMAACDTVILFDLPLADCLSGARARLGEPRPDIPWVDTELDPTFAAEIERFGKENLPTVYALLERCKEGRRVEIFKCREAADNFINNPEQLH